MMPENSTMPELSTDREPRPCGRVDPVAVAVQVALALYLLPVILLVVAIGATSILFGRLIGMTSRAARPLLLGAAEPIARDLPGASRVIGTRPVVGPKRKRYRVIR
jgi:hypothetical protein